MNPSDPAHTGNQGVSIVPASSILAHSHRSPVRPLDSSGGGSQQLSPVPTALLLQKPPLTVPSSRWGPESTRVNFYRCCHRCSRNLLMPLLRVFAIHKNAAPT